MTVKSILIEFTHFSLGSVSDRQTMKYLLLYYWPELPCQSILFWYVIFAYDSMVYGKYTEKQVYEYDQILLLYYRQSYFLVGDWGLVTLYLLM